MANEDYQLEELENAAVNKSNNAKRIAAAAGLMAAGGAGVYAATNIPTGSDSSDEDSLDVDDLEPTVVINNTQEPEPKAKEEPKDEPKPKEPEPEPEPEVTFDKTTHYINEDGERVMTTEEGTINGRKFIMGDVDDDMRADFLGYDVDGNGMINTDEVVELNEENKIAMGHATSNHEDIFLANNDVMPDPGFTNDNPIDIEREKDYAENNGIHNDFEDEKTGESYSRDYAENNEDYNNNGDVGNYSAGMSEHTAYTGTAEHEYEEYVAPETDYTASVEEEMAEPYVAEDYAPVVDGTENYVASVPEDTGYNEVEETTIENDYEYEGMSETADNSYDDGASDPVDII